MPRPARAGRPPEKIAVERKVVARRLAKAVARARGMFFEPQAVIARSASDEAIQIVGRPAFLDCFATLAMTDCAGLPAHLARVTARRSGDM